MLPPLLARRSGAIVLVHGAWVGEWSWAPVMPGLAASGRPIHAVSLTGHGARRHESGPHVTLADHVADVVGVIESHDLVDVTLVGHSYGGRVITAAHTHVADRVGRLVYLDAHAPVGPDRGQSPERRAEAAANGGMIRFSGYDPDPAEFGGPAGVDWFMSRVVPQSFATFTEPIMADFRADVDLTYVFARGSGPTAFSAYADAARSDPNWRYHEFESSHWLMFSHPAEIVAIIVGDR